VGATTVLNETGVIKAIEREQGAVDSANAPSACNLPRNNSFPRVNHSNTYLFDDDSTPSREATPSPPTPVLQNPETGHLPGHLPTETAETAHVAAADAGLEMANIPIDKHKHRSMSNHAAPVSSPVLMSVHSFPAGHTHIGHGHHSPNANVNARSHFTHTHTRTPQQVRFLLTIICPVIYPDIYPYIT
jgi:hypothetical protein